ncbi:hypothetical protein [Paragemmobacter straminiformis]|uniref:hypothetical protein n=1 Tax=Paragemmobacter straminiformis TaxID=2045119 RepID=UPI00163B3D45|nr:hypothetical protein [Gemmobacter straminiformis]
MLASVPSAVHAAAPSPQVLCEAALADPKGFRIRDDFDASVAAMADTCPEVVLMLLDLPTQSIVFSEVDGATPTDPATPPAVDNSAVLGALATALENLKTATTAVTTAQATLDTATTRVRALRALQEALVAKADAPDRLLVDFTAGLGEALDEYNAAKQNLADKQAALTKAKADAETQFDIAGVTTKVGTAQTALDGKLGDKTFEELMVEYGAAVASAGATVTAKTAEAAQLATQIAALQTALDAMGPLQGLQGKLTSATNGVNTKQSAYDKAVTDYNKAVADKNAAYANWLEKKAIADSCTGPGCNGKIQQADNAKIAYVSAQNKITTENAKVQQAQTDLTAAKEEKTKAEAAVTTYTGTQAEIAAKAAAKAAAEKAAADAKVAGAATQGEIEALGALQDTLDQAQFALEEAQASVAVATEDEGKAVADAQKRLEDAIANAVDLLDGSPEEAAAKKAITDAQAALDAALKAQAQAVADAAVATAAAEGNADAEVVAAVDKLTTAVGEGEATAETAQELDATADGVIADNQAAHDALEKQLVTDGVIKTVEVCDCKAPDAADTVTSLGEATVAEAQSTEESNDTGDAAGSDSAASSDAGSSDSAGGDSGSATGSAGGDTGSDSGSTGGDAGASTGGDAAATDEGTGA